MQRRKDAVTNKKVLFVTTKNIDYIRNTQEIRLIENNAQLIDMLYSDKQRYVQRIIEVWIKLLKYNMKNIDVVFIGFAPQLILPFFYWKVRNKTIIIDFFISLYDTLIHDRKKFRDGGVIAHISHWLDKNSLLKAECVIADTKADAEYFINEFKSDAGKFKTLYLEADSSIYYPREQCKPDELKDKFVVLYFGSILPLQGVDIVLDAVKLLKDNRDIYFQVIGPIANKYDKPIQDNVEYIEWLSQKKLAEYIANADLCLAGHFNGEIDKARRTIPGKAFIYRTMEKPMICGDCVANRELFSENEKIKFVIMGDSIDLKNAIMHIQLERWKVEI